MLEEKRNRLSIRRHVVPTSIPGEAGVDRMVFAVWRPRWGGLGCGCNRARWLGMVAGWLLVYALYVPQLELASPARKPQPDDELYKEAQRLMPSLPLDYWHKHKDDKKECAPLPSIYELEFTNTYWQTLRASEGTFHVWGAYLDRRPASHIGPAVRLLAVHDRIKPTITTHCQLWFEERATPVLARTLEYKYVWHAKWGNYRVDVWQPYLVVCVLPHDVSALVPAAVSLVEHECDRASNLLRVYYDAPADLASPDHEFGVCVTGLGFLHEDVSVRLIEWLELVLLLGARRVHVYWLQLHPNVSRVLDYYKQRGDVTVTPLTLPGGQPNLPALQHMYLKKKTTHKRQMELIPYNDCLYRNMYRYRRLVLLDIDEIIVPLRDPDWSSLLRRVAADALPAPGHPPRSSYHASNVNFLDSLRHEYEWEAGASRFMYMLQHVWRSKNFNMPGQYVKAFHETSRVLALHHHFPLACLGGACSSYAIPNDTAWLQHYRADCVTAFNRCSELRRGLVRDHVLWRWRNPLVARVNRALADLDYLPASVAATADTPPQPPPR